MAGKLKQDVSIGQNLQKYRLKAGLSQESAAGKLQEKGLDISREMLSQMELGKYNIRISVLLELTYLYRTPIQDFFEGLQRFE